MFTYISPKFFILSGQIALVNSNSFFLFTGSKNQNDQQQPSCGIIIFLHAGAVFLSYESLYKFYFKLPYKTPALNGM